jgi:hypothetical protein
MRAANPEIRPFVTFPQSQNIFTVSRFQAARRQRKVLQDGTKRIEIAHNSTLGGEAGNLRRAEEHDTRGWRASACSTACATCGPQHHGLWYPGLPKRPCVSMMQQIWRLWQTF